MSMFFASVAVASWRDRRWSAEQFRNLQQSRLAELVRHARERVPFYADRYQKIDPRNFNLKDLPSVTKAEVMSSYADTVTDRAVTLADTMRTIANGDRDGFWLHGKYLVSVTGGTSGVLGHFLNDRRSWARQSGYIMARTLRGRMGAASNLLPFLSGKRYRMAFLGSGNGGSICTQIGQESPWIGKLLVDRRVYQIRAPYEQTVRDLNLFQPRYMNGYSTFLQRLARSQLAGELQIAPRFVSIGSEAVTPTIREVVESAFPTALVVEQYGSTECPLMANQCPEGRLHINQDCCIVEPMNEQGQPVAPGELSQHILVTNLINHFQPIIRYRIEDSVVISDEPCPCGRAMPVIKIHGRTSDMIWLKNDGGKFVSCSPLAFETIVHKCSGLLQYQFLYEQQNELQLKIVPESSSATAQVTSMLRQRIEAYLRQEGCLNTVKFRIDPVHAIERIGGQKMRSVLSKVGPPPASERKTS